MENLSYAWFVKISTRPCFTSKLWCVCSEDNPPASHWLVRPLWRRMDGSQRGTKYRRHVGKTPRSLISSLPGTKESAQGFCFLGETEIRFQNSASCQFLWFLDLRFDGQDPEWDLWSWLWLNHLWQSRAVVPVLFSKDIVFFCVLLNKCVSH